MLRGASHAAVHGRPQPRGRDQGRRRRAGPRRPTSDAGPYCVDYQQYWVDEQAGKVFCLVEAPDPETAATVHREAHGLVADEIHEVVEGL